VIQLGYENPFRLAEDLATVDVLSNGRLQAGLRAGPPGYDALLGVPELGWTKATLVAVPPQTQRLGAASFE